MGMGDVHRAEEQLSKALDLNGRGPGSHFLTGPQPILDAVGIVYHAWMGVRLALDKGDKGQDVRQDLGGIVGSISVAVDTLRAARAPAAPGVVSPAQWNTIDSLVKSVEMAKDKHGKGQALEELLATLFETIPGFSVSEHVRTATEEIDISIVNGSDDPRLKREEALILAECKNWSSKCGKNEIVAFREKMLNRRERCSLGFLISWNGFARTVKMERLRSSQEKACVALLDGKDIQEAAGNRSFLPALLSAWHAVVNL